MYYRIFYILTFLLISASATAQGKLELKTEVLGLAFDTRAELSLEYLLGERVGIEAGVGYDWDNGASPRFDSSLMLIYVNVERRELSAYLQGKYYFSPKVGADRFFAGLSLHYITIPTYKIDGEEFIKKQFQKLFREKADDLFTTLGEDKFRSLFGTDDIDVFKSLVAEGQPITFDFFNFVKVK